jgi:hypothetical protein
VGLIVLFVAVQTAIASSTGGPNAATSGVGAPSVFQRAVRGGTPGDDALLMFQWAGKMRLAEQGDLLWLDQMGAPGDGTLLRGLLAVTVLIVVTVGGIVLLYTARSTRQTAALVVFQRRGMIAEARGLGEEACAAPKPSTNVFTRRGA